MSPLAPHWKQPSHPAVQQVLAAPPDDASFTTKSLSRVRLPPFALFARLDSPPCTPAAAPTYATVQVGRYQHINLNSDLLYINHSCEPTLIFDTSSRVVWVGPRGLAPGDELTFFYPSTEWDMAQPFACLCGTPSCRGRISGARHMPRAQLEGVFLNAHIWDLLGAQEKAGAENTTETEAAADTAHPPSPTLQALQEILTKAEDTLGKADEAAEAARRALVTYRRSNEDGNGNGNGSAAHVGAWDLAADGAAAATTNGATRRGPTSRELSGEMGGDTKVQ